MPGTNYYIFNIVTRDSIDYKAKLSIRYRMFCVAEIILNFSKQKLTKIQKKPCMATSYKIDFYSFI